MLPMIAQSIEGMLSAATKMHRMLTEAKNRFPLLDMATIERLLRAHTQQKDDLWLFEEQLRRWLTLPLTIDQQEEITRLQRELQQLNNRLTAILQLARELQVAVGEL